MYRERRPIWLFDRHLGSIELRGCLPNGYRGRAVPCWCATDYEHEYGCSTLPEVAVLKLCVGLFKKNARATIKTLLTGK